MLSQILLWDGLRVVALIEGGIVFGLALAEAWLYYRRKRMVGDPWYGHRRLDFMALVRVGIAALTLSMTVVVATRLGDSELTFRAPAAIVAFTLLLIGMVGILRDDETIQDDRSLDFRRHVAQDRGRRQTDNIA